MKVTRTLHHSVNVEGRLAETVAFYRHLFDMPDEARPDPRGGRPLVRGRQRPAPPGRRCAGHRAGSSPPVPTSASPSTDLDAAIAELGAAGIPYAEGAQGTTVQIWFVDPAGNTIEIQQDPDC